MRQTVTTLVVTLLVSACAGKTTVTPTPSTRPPTPMHQLIPLPVLVELSTGNDFAITPATIISVPAGDERLLRIGRALAGVVGLSAGPEPLRVAPQDGAAAESVIELQLGDVSEAGDEAYEITMMPARATIKGRTPAGVFYGVQTLRQLLPPFVEHDGGRFDKTRPVRAPAVRIVDRPRFAWRGAMLDVARHFFSVDEVKRYIDLIALHKINRLHLHLADDQGWRIEIKSWPNLTARRRHAPRSAAGPAASTRSSSTPSSSRTRRDRFITIVPEIDMPGHTNAALASYAELNCDGKAPAALHRHRSRLQRALRRQGDHLQVHRRRGPRDCGDDAGPVLSHRRRRGEDADAGAVRRSSSSACRRSCSRTASR